MRKILLGSLITILSIVLSLSITFLFFYTMSWYNFGDDITKVVLFRMLLCFGILLFIFIIIGINIFKTTFKPTKN